MLDECRTKCGRGCLEDWTRYVVREWALGLQDTLLTACLSVSFGYLLVSGGLFRSLLLCVRVYVCERTHGMCRSLLFFCLFRLD